MCSACFLKQRSGHLFPSQHFLSQPLFKASLYSHTAHAIGTILKNGYIIWPHTPSPNSLAATALFNLLFMTRSLTKCCKSCKCCKCLLGQCHILVTGLVQLLDTYITDSFNWRPDLYSLVFIKLWMHKWFKHFGYHRNDRYQPTFLDRVFITSLWNSGYVCMLPILWELSWF